MAKQLNVKKIDKDFRQVFVGEEPTNIFINKDGKIRTKSIQDDVLHDEITISAEKIAVKSSEVYLDGTTDITLKETSSKIRIVDPANSTEKLEIYHSADDVIISSTDSTNIVMNAGDGQTIEFWYNGNLRERISGISNSHAFHYDSNNYFQIDVDANGATSLSTVDAGVGIVGNLTLDPDGELIIETASGKTTHSKAAIGFTKISETVGASSTTIDFRDGNKAEIRLLVYNNTTLNLRFPPYSGNFTLVMEQYLTGNIAIATWKALDSEGNDANNDGGSAGAIRWAGGSAPTLSTSAGSFDIISFYWDADREMAFGVPSLNFS